MNIKRSLSALALGLTLTLALLWLLSDSPTLAHARPLRSIAGSTVTPNPSYYTPATANAYTFTVSNGSTDLEYLDVVTFTLPSDWTITAVATDTQDSCGHAVSFSTGGVGTHQVAFTDSDGGYGEIYSGCSWNAALTVTVPGHAAGEQAVNWALAGDVYGSAPHNITGTFTLKPPQFFDPDTLRGAADPGGDARYAPAIHNHTGATQDVTLTYSCTWPITGPTTLPSITSDSSVTFPVTVTVPSGVPTGTVKIATVTATGGGHAATATLQTRVGASQWTFMVYVDGDNDLEYDALDDFLEMASVGSTDDVNIVLQVDRIDGYSTDYGDWTTAKRFYVTHGMTPDPGNALADLGEVNMGHADTLRHFAEWAMASYPAQKYALVLWDHGAGWYPRSREHVTEGVAWDDTNGGDYLSNAEISAVLEDVTDGGAHPIEMVGFDACLMAMVEVDIHIAPYARARASSQAFEPADGWPYDTILSDLTATPTMTGTPLADTVVERYYASYGNNRTHSAVQFSSDFDVLVDAVDAFAAALNRHIDPYRSVYTDARTTSQEFESPPDYDDFIDLYDFASEIHSRVSEGQVRGAAQAVMDAVDAAVTNERHGPSWPDARGIAIYFPDTSSEWDDWRASYLGSGGYQWLATLSRWDQFLQYYWDDGSQLACIGAGTLPFNIPVVGDTRGSANHAEGYGCANWNESGPEDVYTFALSSQADVTLILSATGNLDLFLLDGCDEFADCLSCGDTHISGVALNPGTYYVVVDGYFGDAGPYELLRSVCNAPTGVSLAAGSPVVLGQAMHFTATVSPPDATGPLAYAWDFGGPGSGSGLDTAAPLYTYAAPGDYTATVTATGQCGDPVSDTIAVTVVCTAPTGLSLATDSPAVLGQAMRFTATVSPPDTTGPLAYAWDFGGPGSGSGLDTATPLYSYAAPGDYTATVTASGQCGDPASDTIAVTVVCTAPTGVSLAAGSPVTLGQAMRFTATVSPPDATGPLAYAWDFGGPGSGSGLDTATPRYTYATPGDYTVTVTATGQCGSPVSSATGVVVHEPSLAAFTASPTSGVAPLTVAFTDTSTGAVTSWAWTFGDGGVSSQRHPTHTYTSPSVYTVSLTVTGPGGNDTLRRTNYITVLERAGDTFYLPLVLKLR